LEQLGYPVEASLLKGNLSDLPKNWPGGGFTNPFTKNVGISPGDCTGSGNPYSNLVYTVSLLYHEARHVRTQGRLDLLGNGIDGHWFGDGDSLRALELPIYQDEYAFLGEWLRQSRSAEVTQAINSRREWVRNHILELKEMR
jgi:hypothetical protein